MSRTPGFEHIDSSVWRWDDLRFPASSTNPPGAVSDPDLDASNGGWLFAATGTEVLFYQAQMPHSWWQGSVLVPHVHWQKTTAAAGDVMWRFDLKWAPIGEVMDAAFTTLTESETVAGTSDTDEADKHLITSFGDVDAEGKGVSDMLIMRVSRLGNDAADTYGADARLLEFDIHHLVDGEGSNQEFVKSGISR